VKAARYGMVVDIDGCNGCGACTLACAAENNIPPVPERATSRTGLAWMRVERLTDRSPEGTPRVAFVPMMCQHCGRDTPCVHVCPQNAVEVDPKTGIVAQIPVRCLGCRYCMAACPFHARAFNWWDPQWPKGMEDTLNPGVSTRSRGVVEKCNLCHGRLQAARERAAAAGREELTAEDGYLPACVESCPNGAILFGDLDDPKSDVARAVATGRPFRWLDALGLDTKIYYTSEQPFVRKLARSNRGGQPG
jgi:menaquinone reductase, iron-sulfur cluster-binding subunit